MTTIHATEAAESAQNTNRCDWVVGATELVLTNQVQYDRSTRRGKEAYISLDNVLEDVLGMDATKELVKRWLMGSECCDERDTLNTIVGAEIMRLLKQMADDFEIGVS